MNVFEKLQKCRVELQKTQLKKSGKNNYSGFDYFVLNDFLPTVNELFEKYRLFSNFSITQDGLAILDIIDTEWISQENRKDESIEFFKQNSYFFKATFTSPIEELELKGCNKIQALGGVHTYMKRYLYFNALEIVENDMFDPMTRNKPDKKSKLTSKSDNSISKTEFITLAQKEELRNKIGGKSYSEEMNACGGKMSIEKYEKLMAQKGVNNATSRVFE